MILRIFAISNALSIAIGVGLALCLPHLGWMIAWLLAFAVYLGAMLWWVIELEHIDRSMVPASAKGRAPTSDLPVADPGAQQ